MTTKFFAILSLCFCLSSGIAFCSSSSEIRKQLEFIQSQLDNDNGENAESSKMSKTILISNISYLENYVIKKIEKLESKAVKYQQKLNSSQDEETTQKYLKKLESTQQKIKDFHEILIGIGTLKARMDS